MQLISNWIDVIRLSLLFNYEDAFNRCSWSLSNWISHLSSLLSPTHTRPPCRGDGLLHERWRSSKPVPQVVLHCPQEDHGVQPPFLWQQTHEKALTHLTNVLHNYSPVLLVILFFFNALSFVWLLLRFWTTVHRKRRLTRKHSFNLLKCFVPG